MFPFGNAMRMKTHHWLLILFVINSVFAKLNFTGHRLIGVYPSSSDELSTLRHLAANPQVDFWKEPSRLHENITLRLPPEVADKVEHKLRRTGLDFYVITDNLQKWIEREEEENEPGEYLAGRVENFSFDVYHPLNEIESYLEEIDKKYSNFTSIIKLATTFEGNVIKAVKISSGKSDQNRAVWIDGGIHSREWIAPATTLYIINHILTGYGVNDRITQLVDMYDWYLVPMVNPDGYEYTWRWNRLWRKNRSISHHFPGLMLCRGTDPNRNFDVQFGGLSTSVTPCSAIYKGDYAFSEAESMAIRDGVTNIKNRLLAYFTLHSFSQLWMTPHGYTTLKAPDHDDHMDVLNEAVTAVQAKHGVAYKYGPSAQTLYPVSGSASDWVYDVAGVKYSFAIELRDTGVFGFLLPRTEIIPSGEETWAGIEAAMLRITKKVNKDQENQKS